MRAAALAALAVAGCGGAPRDPYFIDDGALVGVASDQGFVLESTDGGGGHFQYRAVPLPGTTAVALDGVPEPDPPRLVAGTVVFTQPLRFWNAAMSSPWDAGAPAAHASASADGSLFAWWDGATPDASGHIYLLRARDCRAGGCVPRIAGTAANVDLSVAPDGGRVAYQPTAPQAGRSQLFLVDAETLSFVKLLDLPSTFDFLVPQFSPDGALVAVNAMGAGASELHVFATADHTERAWMAPPGAIVGHRFVDAATLLVITSDGNGRYDSFLAGATTLAPMDIGAGATPEWMVAGHFLVEKVGDAAAQPPAWRIARWDLAAVADGPLLLSNASDGTLRVDGAGDRVAFVENGRLSVAAIDHGTRFAMIDGVRGEDADFVAGDSALLYLQGGALHRWSGADQVVETGVANFETAKSPATLYYTLTDEDPAANPPRRRGLHARPLP